MSTIKVLYETYQVTLPKCKGCGVCQKSCKCISVLHCVVQDQKVFIYKSSRKHYSFNFKSKLIQQVPYKALVKQIITTTMSLVNFNVIALI